MSVSGEEYYDGFDDEEYDIQDIVNAEQVTELVTEKYKRLIQGFKAEIARYRTLYDESVDKVHTLQRENAELAHGLKKIDSRMEEFKRELEKANISNVLTKIGKPVYEVVQSINHVPKCDKCNEERKVVFTDADGRTILGNCKCAETTYSYSLKKLIGCTLTIYGNTVTLYRNDYEKWNSTNIVTSKDDFDIFYNPLFYSKELAEEFIKYKEEKQARNKKAT